MSWQWGQWRTATATNTAIPSIPPATTVPYGMSGMYAMENSLPAVIAHLQCRINELEDRLKQMEELWQTHYCAVHQTQEGEIVIETSDCEKCKAKVLK